MKIGNLAKSKPALATLITLLSVLAAYLLSLLGVIDALQLKATDALFAIRGPAVPADTSIVIVAIDDQCMASMPSKWPYPENYYARMINNLSQAGARLIVFDIEFTEANTIDREEDLLLARAVVDAKNVILAGKVVFEAGSSGTVYFYVLSPIAPLLRTSATWGVVNTVEDPDGFLRRYLLYYTIGKRNLYSLSIEALKALSGAASEENINPAAPTFQIGKYNIPKATVNSMFINFRGPAGTFRTYSLAAVLDDSTFDLLGDEDTNVFELHKEWGTFKDKIVFVGASAEEMQDNKYAPFFQFEGRKRKIPGVEIHANALSTILRGDYLVALDPLFQFIIIIILTAITSVTTLSLRPFKALAAVTIAIILILTGLYFLFIHWRIIASVTLPVLAIVLSYIGNTVYQTVTDQREKSRIRRTFQQYVAPQVVEKMLNSREMPSYGGERRELTVLFSDIRRFTNFSETHEPEIVVSRLQEYLSEMVDVIFKYNGTLDKFVGDEIMALYGAPYHLEDHAKRACSTAIEMVDKLRDIQKRWSADRKVFFHIGIGINTGKVIVGNLGSKQLFDYTVIGDQVNLGARLEGANKEYQTTIIISESTYDQVRDLAKVRELDSVRVLGKTVPIRIFELRGMDTLPQIEQDYIIDVFSEGLLAYRERRWADALKSFRRVLRYFPSDGPSRIYTIRCLDFIENPPPFEWDGVYDFTRK
jgi:adenylate cyclase